MILSSHIRRLIPDFAKAPLRRVHRGLRAAAGGGALSPFAHHVRLQAYGAEFRFPARFRFHRKVARVPPAPTWKSTFFGALCRDERSLFLDIGANNGQTLLEFAASPAPQRYIGFEPNPVCAGYCNDLILANDLDAAVYACALADTAGAVSLLVNPDVAHDTGASIMAGLRPGRELRGVPVVHLPLASFRGMIDYSDIAMVKIDVEGAELMVLEGAEDLLAEGDAVIICEVLRPDDRSDPEAIAAQGRRLQALMEKHGYGIYAIVKATEEDRLLRLEPVTAFPSERWTRETATLNDYLFARPHHLDLFRSVTQNGIGFSVSTG